MLIKEKRKNYGAFQRFNGLAKQQCAERFDLPVVSPCKLLHHHFLRLHSKSIQKSIVSISIRHQWQLLDWRLLHRRWLLHVCSAARQLLIFAENNSNLDKLCQTSGGAWCPEDFAWTAQWGPFHHTQWWQHRTLFQVFDTKITFFLPFSAYFGPARNLAVCVQEWPVVCSAMMALFVKVLITSTALPNSYFQMGLRCKISVLLLQTDLGHVALQYQNKLDSRPCFLHREHVFSAFLALVCQHLHRHGQASWDM